MALGTSAGSGQLFGHCVERLGAATCERYGSSLGGEAASYGGANA